MRDLTTKELETVSGGPHVHEGDGPKWDIKENQEQTDQEQTEEIAEQ